MKKIVTVLLLVLLCLLFFAACNEGPVESLFSNKDEGFSGEINSAEDFELWTDYGGDACLTKDLTLYGSYDLVPGKGGSDFNLNLNGHILTFGNPADLSKGLEPLKKAKKASVAKVTVTSTVKLVIKSTNDTGASEPAKIEVKLDTTSEAPAKQGTLIQNEGGTVGLKGVDVGNEGGGAPLFTNTQGGEMEIKDSILTSSPTDNSTPSDLIMTDSGEVKLDNVDTDKKSDEPLIKVVNSVENVLTSNTDAEEPAYKDNPPKLDIVDSFKNTTPSDLIDNKNKAEGAEIKTSVSATVTVSPTDLSILEGETATIEVFVTPTDDWTLLWTTSGNGVTSVSDKGVVTALKAGKDTVRVTIDGKPNVYAECEVTVISKTREIELEQTSLTLAPKASEKLTVVVTPSDAEPEFVWTVSGSGVTTVTDDGTVTAVTTGTDVVTVTVSGTDFTASCTVNVDYYTVSFNMCGHGTQVATPTDVCHGDKLAEPETPTATDWTFEGWYKDAAFTENWDFDNDTVEADTTLYAKWSESRIVRFEMNGHGTTTLSDLTVSKGARIEAPSTPTDEGYVFKGWYKDSKFAEAWNFDNDTVAENITLYAKWNSTHTVTFSMSGRGTTTTDTVEDGGKITTPTDPTTPGYVFDGWFIDATFTTPCDFNSFTVTDDVTLYARWTMLVKEILNTAEGGFPTAKTTGWKNDKGKSLYLIEYALYVDDGSIGINGKKATCIDDSTYEYRGKCWSTKDCVLTFKLTEGKLTSVVVSGLSGDSYQAFNGEYDAAKVSFNMNGHGTTPTSLTVGNSGLISTPTDNPTADGWVFKGWYKEQACTNVWDFSTDTVTEDITLYAKWNSTHTVTFSMSGRGTTATDTVEDGGKITKPADPTSTGYVFDGWFIDAAFTTSCDFNSFTVTDDVTLYARWTMTLLSILNTADGGFPTKEANGWLNSSNNGKTLYCSSKALYVGGQAFITGMDKKNATYVNDSTYKYTLSGAVFTFTLTEGKLTKISITGVDNGSTYVGYNGVYAKTLPGNTVSFDMNGHGTTPTSMTVEIGGYATTPTDPTENGWAFKGWYKEQACTNAWNFSTDTVTQDTTLYAKWVKVYTVKFNLQNSLYETEKKNKTPASQTVEEGGKVSDPTGDDNVRKCIEGWYTDTSYTDKWNFSTDTVTTDTNLYAKWDSKKVGTIISTADGGFPNTYTNGWQETSNTDLRCHINLNKYEFISFTNNSASNGLTINMNKDTILSGDNYVYTATNQNVTFVMSEGKLTSIIVNCSSEAYKIYNGTYVYVPKST